MGFSSIHEDTLVAFLVVCLTDKILLLLELSLSNVTNMALSMNYLISAINSLWWIFTARYNPLLLLQIRCRFGSVFFFFSINQLVPKSGIETRLEKKTKVIPPCGATKNGPKDWNKVNEQKLWD